jgi:hypothetical protein
MADNVDVDPGTSASKVPVATDDCGAAGHFQRIKLDIGGDGVSSPVVAGNGLPVSGPLTDTELRATAVPVSATSLDIRDLTSASDSVAAVQSGTWNIGSITTLPSIPAGTNNIGDVDVLSLPAATSGGAANVASSATNVTLLSSNSSRKGFTIMNDSTAILYVKFGATASSTSFHVKMAAGSYYESPAGVNYTGIIDGIWASANGSARVGEFT